MRCVPYKFFAKCIGLERNIPRDDGLEMMFEPAEDQTTANRRELQRVILISTVCKLNLNDVRDAYADFKVSSITKIKSASKNKKFAYNVVAICMGLAKICVYCAEISYVEYLESDHSCSDM